ncbi:putative protein ABSCISIC ACID-INSENSITIVE 5-like [Capsicum annuum]|nr:putative protein ABSCISIC ACID-INSENSITIVE 5-like [Capsicum annuum]
MQSLGIYIVSIDRPGYGESDPHPKRTPKTLALDIEELADQLELGSKFYVIGFSMGGQAIWGLLKYIPHRLAGAILLTPVTNYWWGSFPANLTKQAYYEQLVQDQWTLRISHYLPWLTYWWNTQKWFPSSSVATFSEDILFEQDRVLMPIFDEYQSKYRDLVRQQGDYESIHRDLMIGFGTWEFDPMELENPFPNGEGSVHIWQGDEDGHVPVLLQRYVAKKLPWIHYHEMKGGGHMFPWAEGMGDKFKASGRYILKFGFSGQSFRALYSEDLVRQQGEYESIHRDIMIGFGTWEFDPMELENPFPNREGSVHIWQGDEDGHVPVLLQRHIAKKLPWIHYHEMKGGGHMFPWAEGMGDKVMKTFLLGEPFVM